MQVRSGERSAERLLAQGVERQVQAAEAARPQVQVVERADQEEREPSVQAAFLDRVVSPVSPEPEVPEESEPSAPVEPSEPVTP
jgi:hypothetical protein